MAVKQPSQSSNPFVKLAVYQPSLKTEDELLESKGEWDHESLAQVINALYF